MIIIGHCTSSLFLHDFYSLTRLSMTYLLEIIYSFCWTKYFLKTLIFSFAFGYEEEVWIFSDRI